MINETSHDFSHIFSIFAFKILVLLFFMAFAFTYMLLIRMRINFVAFFHFLT